MNRVPGGRIPRARAACGAVAFTPRVGAVAFTFLAWAFALLFGAGAFAHMVAGSTTLSQRVALADVVARARIVDDQAILVLDSPSQRRPVVEVELLEVLKGSVEPGPLRFAQHGHGRAEFTKGAEVLVFLSDIDRNRELAGSPLRGVLRFVSSQEHDAGLALTPATRASWKAATRGYVSLGKIQSPAGRLESRRRLTLDLLHSDVPRIAQDALRDLVVAGEGLAPAAADLPALVAKVGDPEASIGLRVGLLAELTRRGLAPDAPTWTDLLKATQGSDRVAVIRAAGANPTPEVTESLIDILKDGDPTAAPAAAIALGSPGNRPAVAPLGEALAAPDSRMRMAAIRGLGRVATPEALALLEAAARSHTDPATQRRARAEATLVARSGRLR